MLPETLETPLVHGSSPIMRLTSSHINRQLCAFLRQDPEGSGATAPNSNDHFHYAFIA